MTDKIILSLLSAGIGTCLGFLLQYYRAALSEELVLLNDHIKDLEKFGEQAVKYWTEHFKNFTENQSSASRVMALHYGCFHLYETIIENCHERSKEYDRLSQKLSQLATGGSFNSEQHTPDPERSADIVATLSELIHILRISRPYIISPKRTALQIQTQINLGIYSFIYPKRPWLY